MTDCARCGDCCTVIAVNVDLGTAPVDDYTSDGDRASDAFMRQHWHRLDGYDNPRYSCDQFDTETRLCTAHDERPPVCRGFPWYGRPPEDEGRQPVAASLSPRCSFNADVPGRAMLPIVEVRHR